MSELSQPASLTEARVRRARAGAPVPDSGYRAPVTPLRAKRRVSTRGAVWILWGCVAMTVLPALCIALGYWLGSR